MPTVHPTPTSSRRSPATNKNKNNSDWIFNLRTAQGALLGDSDDSDSDNDFEDVGPDNSDPTAAIAEKKLLEDFDLSSRQESVDYKPNPWNIAKINASSRPIDKQVFLNSTAPQTLSKAPPSAPKAPKGRIVDSFKKQAERPPSSHPDFALKPGVPIFDPGSSVNGRSAVTLLPSSSSYAKPACKFQSSSPLRSVGAQHQFAPPSGLSRAIKSTTKVPSSYLDQDSLPSQVPNTALDPPLALSPDHSSNFPNTQNAQAIGRPRSSILPSFSSPTYTSQHVPHPFHAMSYSSPAPPTFENTRFMPRRQTSRISLPPGNVYAPCDYGEVGSLLAPGHTGLSVIFEYAMFLFNWYMFCLPYTGRIDISQPRFENNAYNPSHVRSEEDHLTSTQHLPQRVQPVYDAPLLAQYRHPAPDSNSGVPANTAAGSSMMPRWLEAALPPRPEVNPGSASESPERGYYRSAITEQAELPHCHSSPPLLPPLRICSPSKTSANGTKRRRVPSRSSSPSPIRLRPPPTRIPSYQSATVSAYAFQSTSDADAEWSTLPSRKVSLKPKPGIKQSGRFRLPINLPGTGTGGVPGDGKKRVVRYMPPPMQVTKVRLEDDSSPPSLSPSIHPLSSPTLALYDPNSPSSQSIKVPVKIDAIMSKYPITRTRMSEVRTRLYLSFAMGFVGVVFVCVVFAEEKTYYS